MPEPPIPERIPPLAWREPMALWLPLAMLATIAWPALIESDAEELRLALVASASGLALALATLGASWLAGRAPKARRIIVLHVVLAAAVVAVLAPVAGPSAAPDIAALFAMAPLALMLALPAALLSGIIFAWVALVRPPRLHPAEMRSGAAEPLR